MKKYLCFFLCFLLSGKIMNAQFIPDSLVVDATAVRDSANINRNSYIFIDSTGNASFEKLLWQNFVPFKKYKRTDNAIKGCIIRPFFLKFTCRNSSPNEIQLFFYPGTLYSKIRLYKLHKGADPLPVSQKDNDDDFQLMTLEANSETEFIAELQQDRSGGSRLNPQLIAKSYLKAYEAVHYDQHGKLKTVGFIFSGVLLMMVLFMGTNYLLNKRKEFLYNGIYSLCMCLLVFGYSMLSKMPTFITSLFYSYLDLVLLMVGLIFYIAFTRKFLNTKTHYPTLNKIFRVEEWVFILLLVFYSFIHFFTPYFKVEWWLENIMKFIALGIGIVYIFISFAQKNKLLNYLAAGNAFSIVFSSIALCLILFKVNPAGLLTSALFYTEVGIVLELAFFLYGLAYKNRTELIERTRMEEAIKLETEKQTFEKQLAVLQAQQAERNRISLDMHDDLGSGMTAIRLYSELAKKKITGPIPEIEKISSSADELINKMNAIIWTMSSSNDTLGNLVAYIRSYALGYLEDKGINCIIEADSKIARPSLTF
jgi:signal transduction histidine kinase